GAPFPPDGSREFLEDKPFIEPFSLIPALGAVTTRLRFVTFVLKLPVRSPVLVAKQATSTAVLTGNRLVLGVGTSPWREDYEVLGVPWADRGRRMDEGLAVVRGLSAGGYFEYHGEIFDLPPVKIAPVPSEPIPILIPRHPRPLRRRAPPRRPGRGRVAARRRGGRPARPARPARRVPPAGRHGRPPVRGARDLGRRLQRRRRAAAGGAGGDRRDRRLPLALPDRPPRRAAGGEDRETPPVRRGRHRQGGLAEQEAGGEFELVADVVGGGAPGDPGDQVGQPDVADDAGDGDLVGGGLAVVHGPGE